MTRLTTLAVAGLALVSAQMQPASAEITPQAAEMFRKAGEASGHLTSVAYAMQAYTEGSDTSQRQETSCTVLAERGDSSLRPKLSITGQVGLPLRKPIKRFTYATDGRMASYLDLDAKQYTGGPADRVPFPERDVACPPYWFNAKAFRQEQKAHWGEVRPDEQIGNVLCHVVDVRYEANGSHTARFYFGRDDMLLRRIERRGRVPNKDKDAPAPADVFVIKVIMPNPKTGGTPFFIERPAEYTQRPLPAPPPLPKDETGGTNGHAGADAAAGRAGRTAPIKANDNAGPADNWSLKTMDDKEVTLGDLRGRVVLLDFWATWCGPCRMSMPGVQKMHERFKGKPVSVFGVNCFERNGVERAVAFIKEKGYTYPQLLDDGRVSQLYGVKGIPAFIVIGRDGRVLHRASGYSPLLEAQIVALIENAINK